MSKCPLTIEIIIKSSLQLSFVLPQTSIKV